MLKNPKILILTLAFMVSSLTMSGCVATETVNTYPFDTAKIEYNLSGNLEGTQKVYIKGDNAIHETNAVRKENGREVPVNLLYLELGEHLYEINLSTQEGTKARNPIYNELKQLTKEQRTVYLTKLAVNVGEADNLPATKGEGEYAGQKCQIYDVEDMGEICVWSGIPLYSKLSLAGGEIENTMTATSIEVNTDIPDNLFAVPLGVDIKDLTAL